MAVTQSRADYMTRTGNQPVEKTMLKCVAAFTSCRKYHDETKTASQQCVGLAQARQAWYAMCSNCRLGYMCLKSLGASWLNVECQLSVRSSTSKSWVIITDCIQLRYSSYTCGCSHDEPQTIGISAPVVNSVKAASQSLLPLADKLATHRPQPAQKHSERHGNGDETGGEGVARGDSLTGPERVQQQ